MRVGLLGPLEISEDGRRFSITSAKQRGLIALLALNAGSVVSADRLIDGLWGEGAGGDALSALRHHVSRLRKEIGSTLVTRASGYLLDLEPDHVDAAGWRTTQVIRSRPRFDVPWRCGAALRWWSS